MRVEHEYDRRGALAYLAAWDVHRGQASIDRLTKDWPTAHLIHTPVHASWLNQCEIYFSIVQRKVVSPNDFTDTEQLRQRLAAFENRYNPIATPFGWKFTRRDLRDLLQRIDRHEHPSDDHDLAA